jgi:hypothetical protein
MKKKILVLIIGLLLMWANVYAENGDFIVEGNVGIGTDTPTVELDVNGSINLSPYGTIKQDNITVFKTDPVKLTTFIGNTAGISNTGYYNTAVGARTMQSGTGHYNTAIGLDALMVNTTGYYNAAVGVGALWKNTTGAKNIAMGNGSLYRNTTGSENTALGYFAFANITEGNNNIAIGTGAGENITSGSNNIIIGYDIDAPVSTGSNQLSIGNLIFGTGIDGTGLDISSGNIGIGTNAPTAKLDVAGNAHIGGDLTVDGGIQGTFRVDGKIGVGTGSPATGLEISFEGVQSSSPIRFSGLPAADNILMEPFTDTGYEGWKLVASGTQQELFVITDPSYNPVFSVDVEGKEVGIGTDDPLARFHVKGDGTATTGGQILISGETDVNDKMWIGFDTTDNYGFIQSSADGVTEDLVLNADGGNVGIGTVNPEGKLHTEDLLLDLGTGNCPSGYTEGDYGGGPDADCLATGIVVKADGSVGIGTATPTEKLYVVGDIYATGEVTWGSSREMKENIRELTTGEALTALNELQPKKFIYRADKNDEHVGFIAEEVPELIATKDRKSLNPMDIIAVLTSVVKEQQKIMENQQKEMEDLKEKVQKLEAKDYMVKALQ